MATQQTKFKTQLIVEKGDGELWGRIKVKGNLIVDSAKTLEVLIKNLKKLAYQLEGITITEFEISYDLSSFFEKYSYLGTGAVAEKSGISAGMIRQYASGLKFPSANRLKEIERAIHEIGKDLISVRLHKRELVA